MTVSRAATTAASVAVVASTLLGGLVGTTVADGVLIPLLRCSAVVSFVLFAAGFLTLRADEAPRLRPAFTGLGITHGFHLGVIAVQVSSHGVPSLVGAIVGGAAYLGIFLAAVMPTSATQMKRIGWFIWAVFLATFSQRATERPSTSGVGLVAALVVAGARLVLTRQEGRDQVDAEL